MKRLLSVIVGTLIAVHLAQGEPRREDKQAHNLRTVILSHKWVHEDRGGGIPDISWHFGTNGTFQAAALTGLQSWSASGAWHETTNGNIVVDGMTDHAHDPSQKRLPFKRTIIAAQILDRNEDIVWVRLKCAEVDDSTEKKK